MSSMPELTAAIAVLALLVVAVIALVLVAYSLGHRHGCADLKKAVGRARNEGYQHARNRNTCVQAHRRLADAPTQQLPVNRTHRTRRPV